MIFNLFKRKKEVPPSPDPAQKEKGLPEQEASQSRMKEPEQASVSSPQISETPETPAEPETDEKGSGSGLFSRLKSGLSKTRDVLTTDINELFTSAKAIDEDLFEELEELLVTSDLGLDITMEMMDRIRKKSRGLSSANELKQVLKDELIALFPSDPGTEPDRAVPKPRVIMMVGVNGTGKTTTLGKLAMKYTRQGKKVLIAAADTFRAAAIEQVEIWADRSNASIVKHREGADPAAVAYDAVEASMARGIDVLLIDTAGRLHTQKNLMEELKKIQRTVGKKMKGAPHEVLMVLDATTGQNAVSQARIFNEAVGLSQIALTKLDGTAKGGIVAAISKSMDLPIKYIGVGESIDDLQEFDAKLFINALFED
ncbi:signal recognition particle-docking protein FtsY [Desulfospira joergensenii]|uniref:signal recognition particle-docking protein FtsY n=1 Tax=Desulfospira joergensenii TaxID=53329 RepID=UPI0003B51F35|nr:signal recognition particle-docking protein FtsY [Desulfospira joergensenii]